MKKINKIALSLILPALSLMLSPSAHSQSPTPNEMGLYKISDIGVDVTAPTAAQARDKAIADAQSTGFDQLLSRLDSATAAKPDETTLARLVQGFEVQKEKSLAGRYIATLAVQYKPTAVRDYLAQKGVAFTEKQSAPFVILPIVKKDAKKTILWEDRTPWRSAWEESSRNGGMVPVMVPTGDLDDIKLISAPEAIEGKSDSIQSLAQKYQAGGVIVALLEETTEPTTNQPTYKATLRLFDAQGIAEVSDTITKDVTPPLTSKGQPAALAELVKKSRIELESTWKRAEKSPTAPTTAQPTETAHLIVTIDAPTLETWQKMRTKIDSASSIVAQNILSMTRGAIQVELVFKGDIPSLQTALSQKDLTLSQSASGAWIISASGAGIISE